MLVLVLKLCYSVDVMKKIILSDRVSQLKPSPTLAITARAQEMRKGGADIISFGAGEPDFDTPSNIKNAAIAGIDKGFTKYTPSSGIAELKNVICEKFKKDNLLNFSPEQIIVSCGAKHALYNSLQVLCNKGDEIIIIAPYWVSYIEMIRLAGGIPKIVPADENKNYVIDTARIKKAVSARTKAIIINSPSNPTGAVYPKAILEDLAEIALSKKIFLISDEIYEKLIYDDEKHFSVGSLSDKMAELTLTINGVSKTYAMTGWRIGYMGGPIDVIKKISALQSHSTSNPTSISQLAAVEALTGDQAVIERMKNEFIARRDYMQNRINSFAKISCVNPKGAFYIFCNISPTNMDSLKFSSRLLEEAGVACVPGIAFGSDNHIRLSFATGMNNIKEGLDRIEKWLNSI